VEVRMIIFQEGGALHIPRWIWLPTVFVITFGSLGLLLGSPSEGDSSMWTWIAIAALAITFGVAFAGYYQETARKKRIDEYKELLDEAERKTSRHSGRY
jgi:hypothetical protein